MLTLFRQNTISSVVALLLVSVVIKIDVIIHPPLMTTLGSFNEGIFFKWEWLSMFYKQSPQIYMLLSVIGNIGLGFWLNYKINEEKLFPRKSYLPGLMFILISSLLPVYSIFSFCAVANFLICMAMFKVMTLANISRPRSAMFDIGMYLGIATLFYTPSVFIILIIPFVVLLFRTFLIQELLAFLLGLFTPFYFVFAWLFNKGGINTIFAKQITQFKLPVQLIEMPKVAIISGLLVILGIYSLFLLNKDATKNVMNIRKKWNAILIHVFLAIIMGSFSLFFPSTPWIIALTPFCILLSHAFQQNNEKYNSFTFLSIVLVLIVVQWVF